MSNPPLTLIPSVSAPVYQAVHATLATLGYRPRLLLPAAGLAAALAEDRGVSAGAVVFLLGARPQHEARIATLIDQARDRPSLALLAGDPDDDWRDNWHDDLIERCGDCAHWPCSNGELAYRLARLCRRCELRCEPAGNHGPEPDTHQAPHQAPHWATDQGLAEALAAMNLIGRAPGFVAAMGRMRRMAACDAAVLISGETGTGKELAARAIHYLGLRAAGPFIPVNCGTLPDHLVENELFGHERGAYTDAGASADGAIAQANGGTLFLDEVEALSPRAQVALLRFLQDKTYRPLGARQGRQADTRVIAAGNADLALLAASERFRSDLFFRLNILPLRLPTLRERVDDVELLTHHFITLYCQRYGQAPKTLDAASLQRLRHYPWPGNIRELENLVHREVLLTPGPLLRLYPGGAPGALSGSPLADPLAAASPPASQDPAAATGTDLAGLGFADAKARAIDAFERAYLIQLMNACAGNVTQAARRAGKERRALGKLLKKHAITIGASASPDDGATAN